MQGEDENWKPMESNPQVMNAFLNDLGFNADLYQVNDLLSIEDWAQQMLPSPALGLIFLYEINQKQMQFKNQQALTLNAADKLPEKLFYMKQQAKNACGTIALFHVVLNAANYYPNVIRSPSFLSEFLQNAQSKNPQEIAKLFKQNNNIKQKHKESVNKGQSQVQTEADTHFIAFVSVEQTLYELDGCKKCPVNHGPCTPQQLVQKGCQKIQEFMIRDPQNLNFTILAITAKGQ